MRRSCRYPAATGTASPSKATCWGRRRWTWPTCFALPAMACKPARWIRNNVPGIHIPDPIIKRLEGAENQKQEGKQLAIDIINEVKEIPGVSGVHVMAYRQEEYVAEIVDESGVLKGRQPWKREIRRDDQMVAERLDHILHDEITETQVDMVKTAH